MREAGDSVSILHSQVIILQTARIYIDASGKVPGWRSAVGLHCKFNRRAEMAICAALAAQESGAAANSSDCQYRICSLYQSSDMDMVLQISA